eukprot:CAMPEP_0173330024 /NCGR_PEP_ID=MMETSP1144-20121109/3027_1 /TAXON_ID=483371 /ORGANISM="non described non described, Strain CCMP2298" /LENGTH=100 /DNA_ID=CAMNT_0014274671 /DNA_START=36 /DNA_END=335 /DNA_ORIENTATION=+
MSGKRATGEGQWRTATDNKTGRLYYFNLATKVTTWTKPMELASPDERRRIVAEKDERMRFFRQMERNISKKIEWFRRLEGDGPQVGQGMGLALGAGYTTE